MLLQRPGEAEGASFLEDLLLLLCSIGGMARFCYTIRICQLIASGAAGYIRPRETPDAQAYIRSLQEIVEESILRQLGEAPCT